MGAVMSYIGDGLARFLSKPTAYYKTFSVFSQDQLQANLRPGDLLLVEGDSRISSAIKYLTQSTWSHVCIYIGEQPGLQPILEADLIEGVITVPLNKYDGFNLRICRPVGLTKEDTVKLLSFLIERLGHQYDTKNIFDLMRYLLPTPPIPQRFRRRMLAFGSGDPTKAICSTLIAQAFQSIRYPILPMQKDEYDALMQTNPAADTGLSAESCVIKQENDAEKPLVTNQAKSVHLSDELLLAKRHFSHFTPRDFDLSPYFEVIKPTLTSGFDYRAIQWSESE
ncbi:YiiX/YebB-like N1pC/P60 family cysteine hydrolase [Brumicola nitratireducens]|uniref:Lipoprotein-like protein n=1 Tax=Glaciecola nitratireducens (strain JCM 12485 / KCTC 12276 / FR1064) TaxID=1085623 RepID=G4QNS4_GLANF|nr:YiiX/YebB-like N1pC/P60 family cysteine hydrolase [Glaciecola nitratireducens]AEP31632.1 lipoprotein-like protein [Glaciecola nitratireducens FR1064]